MINVSGGSNSEPQTPAQPIDYNFAREELMLKELSNDPIQAAIQNLERQHEEDKQSRLFTISPALASHPNLGYRSIILFLIF